MAGPGCGIVLPGTRIKDVRNDLDLLITAVGNQRGDGSLFWVATTRAIGGSYTGESRPFVTDLHSYDDEFDQTETELIADTFGFSPRAVLEIGAMYNQPTDHRLLAEVAAWLAERLGGAIDIDGVLPLPLDHPGLHAIVPYPNVAGTISTRHIIDIITLYAWLNNPSFHMIK